MCVPVCLDVDEHLRDYQGPLKFYQFFFPFDFFFQSFLAHTHSRTNTQSCNHIFRVNSVRPGQVGWRKNTSRMYVSYWFFSSVHGTTRKNGRGKLHLNSRLLHTTNGFAFFTFRHTVLLRNLRVFCFFPDHSAFVYCIYFHHTI